MSRLFDDASSQYLLYSNNIVTAAPFSVHAWVRSDDTDSLQAVLAITDHAGTEDLWTLTLRGNLAGDPVRWTIQPTGSSGINCDTTTGYSANTWHAIAAVEAASNDHRVFIDGGSKGTTFSDRSPGNIDGVSIGALVRSSVSQYMSGRIAEVAIWNAALTDREVATLARGVKPWKVRPQSIAGYWPVWGLHDPEIDLSGNGHNMTLVNGPTQADHAPITTFTPKIWTVPQEIAAGPTIPAAPSDLTVTVI